MCRILQDGIRFIVAYSALYFNRRPPFAAVRRRKKAPAAAFPSGVFPLFSTVRQTGFSLFTGALHCTAAFMLLQCIKGIIPHGTERSFSL